MVIYILLILLAALILAMIIYLARSNSIIREEIQKQSENRLNLLRNEINEREKNKNDVLLSEWQISNEIEIRREAISVNGKQITEDIWSETNLLKDNFSFNPRDIKFIGKYIDLVVFDGVADETDVSIYFISIVKTNKNGQYLYKNKVKEAINNLKYNWKEINV